MHVAHRAGLGVGVVLLVALTAAVVFVGYHFYRRNAKPFRFHYFRVCVCVCVQWIDSASC